MECIVTEPCLSFVLLLTEMQVKQQRAKNSFKQGMEQYFIACVNGRSCNVKGQDNLTLW